MENLLKLLEIPIILFQRRYRPENQDRCGVSEAGLGIRLADGKSFKLAESDIERHLYALGATGCGKTTLILKLIEADLVARRSLVVLDLRGDLVRGALGLCATHGIDKGRVRLLDLREKERPTGFDPLSGKGEPHIRALHLLDVLKGEADSFGVQLEESARNAFLLLASTGESIVCLERIFFDDRFRLRCLDGCDDEALVGFWERYAEMSVEKRIVWASAVLNKVTPLTGVPILRSVLGHPSPIDLGKVLNEPGSVLLVSLAVDELHRSSKMLGSLIVAGIAREMMSRVDLPERDRVPVRLFVDEFENLASEAFEGIIAEGRRFGLSLVLSHQTLAQLPPRLRSVIRNNAATQLFFQCGYEDAAHIAKELPKDIAASDLRSLPVGEALVMDRSGETERVRFHPPRPVPSAKLVEAYRRELLPAPPAVAGRKPREEGSRPGQNRPGLESWL